MARRYEIAKMSSGLWSVQEESDEVLSEVGVSDKRKETRHNIPVEVTIDVFAENGSLSESESTVTENISAIGASVFTTLTLNAGRFVKVTSPQSGASVLAVLRSRDKRAPPVAPAIRWREVAAVKMSRDESQTKAEF